ncbi:MAG TPA: hypothetical protein VJB59_00355, partial [Bdellovibrionota bacterium]|nr:hypothetical protein [Bdellovibrionota bacterium]
PFSPCASQKPQKELILVSRILDTLFDLATQNIDDLGQFAPETLSEFHRNHHHYGQNQNVFSRGLTPFVLQEIF